MVTRSRYLSRAKMWNSQHCNIFHTSDDYVSGSLSSSRLLSRMEYEELVGFVDYSRFHFSYIA